MFKVFKAFLNLVLFPVSLIGVWNFPLEVSQLDEKSGAAWASLLRAVDRETALAGLASALVVWLVITEILPGLLRRIGHPRPHRDLSRRPSIADWRRHLSRLAWPVTFDYSQMLHINRIPDFGFPVFGVRLIGRNNRRSPVYVAAELTVEHSGKRFTFFDANGVDQVKVSPYSAIELHAAIPAGNAGLVSDNRVNEHQFLRDYAPFNLTIHIDGRSISRRFTYARLRTEIDYAKDEVLFATMGKAP